MAALLVHDDIAPVALGENVSGVLKGGLERGAVVGGGVQRLDLLDALFFRKAGALLVLVLVLGELLPGNSACFSRSRLACLPGMNSCPNSSSMRWLARSWAT